VSSLLLIRHGQASLGAADYDVLSPLGVTQARRLGEHLGDMLRPDLIVTGPRVRQRDTAAHMIAAARARGADFPDALVRDEFDEYPALEIMQRHLQRLAAADAELAGHVADLARHPAGSRDQRRAFEAAFQRMMKSWHDGHLEDPGIEAATAFADRVEAGLRELLAPRGRTVLVVSSAGPSASACASASASISGAASRPASSSTTAPSASSRPAAASPCSACSTPSPTCATPPRSPCASRSEAPMDFSIPEPTAELLRRVRGFLDTHLFPVEPELLALGFPAVVPRLMALREQVRAAGLWLPQMPTALGGLGLSLQAHGLVSEQLGQSPFGHYLFNCQAPDAGNMEILHRFGTPAQQQRWLAPLLAGQIRSCFSMTEPDSPGSNPTQLACQAVRDGDHYVINGRKWFTSSADGAQAFAIVMAITAPDAEPHRRASMLIVPTDTPGFRLVRNISIFGHAGADYDSHAEIAYEDCRVPAENLLGAAHAGFRSPRSASAPDGSTTACAGSASASAPWRSCAAAPSPARWPPARPWPTSRPSRSGPPSRAPASTPPASWSCAPPG
jgi:broad specificity phosphatase PhoE